MEGARILRSDAGNSKKKKLLIGAGAALGLLAAGYLGLCVWVGSRQAILPHTSVAGLDVSGMTVEAAGEALSQAAARSGGEMTVTLACQGWSGQLTGGDLTQDWTWAAQQALDYGRQGFLARGGRYLAHLAGRAHDLSLARGDLAGQSAVVSLLDTADQEIGASTQASWAVEGEELVLTKGRTGLAVDREAAWPMIMDAFDQVFEQVWGGENGGAAQVELPVAQEPPQAPDFDALYQEIHTQPQDAQVDPATYQATDAVVGVDFDLDQARDLYAGAGEGESVTVPLVLTQPEETKSSLQAKLFRDLLGKGTSKVGGSSNRKSNVKLSAAACNGVVLMPGEVFSYNNTTGSRTASKGYLPATAYVGGASVDEIGGGICQTSSTIYYAVLHTTLEVVERSAHRYAVGYVPDGMDATVYYGSLDFRFKNNTSYPVKLVTESYDQNGSRYLTVKLYGTNETGQYAVPERTVYDQESPTTQYKADQSVPRGTTRKDTKQNPYTGRKAQTYRYVYAKDGTLLEKQNMGVSSYKMRPTTLLYNPADGDPSTWTNGVPPQQQAAVQPTVPETPAQQPETPETTPETTPGTAPETTPEPAPEAQAPAADAAVQDGTAA